MICLTYLPIKQHFNNRTQVIKNTIQDHYQGILNYFDNRSTNASAESFNAKLKAFRASLRGVRDINFFLFRVAKIYA
ncbi:transposase [Labilibaculum euxinus]